MPASCPASTLAPCVPLAELYGSDLAEAASIDMVLEAAADLRAKLKVRQTSWVASGSTGGGRLCWVR